MSAFMQGLTAGSNVAAGWMDTYERSRKRAEEEALKARRAGIIAAQPEDMGMRYTPEQGAELERIAQSGQYDIGYDQARGAYTVTPKGLGAGQIDPMDGAVPPAGLGDPYTPQPTATYAPTQRFGTFMGQEYEGEMTPERVQGLRNRAMLDTVTDPFERQRLQLTQMQTEEVQGKRDRETATRAAQAQLSEMYARGETPDAAAIMALAGGGADSAALMQTAAAALELDDKQIKASTNKLIADINKASTSPEKFNALLRQFDTDPSDDKVPTLRTNRDGTLQVFLGDQPMTQKFRDTKDMTALSQWAGFHKDQITGDPTGTAVQMLTLEKIRAQISQANAAAAASGRTEPKAPKDLTPQQQRAFDALKSTDAFKAAVERGNQPALRKLLTDNAIPPEAYFGDTAMPPGGGTWGAPPAAATPAAAAPAAAAPAAAAPAAAAPARGLSREQVGQTVTQQQGAVQAEARVRRAAIAAFEQDPRVQQAYDAVRQLRRDGQAARANTIQSQINAQRERFIAERVGGGQ